MPSSSIGSAISDRANSRRLTEPITGRLIFGIDYVPSLILTPGAIVAVFRCKAGILTVLAACSILGLAYAWGRCRERNREQ